MGDVIDRILKDLRFYEVILMGMDYTELTLCTYRPMETVVELFDGIKKKENLRVDIWELDLEDVKKNRDWYPIFCIELHQDYKDLELMAEDLMVSRLSGVIDREMEGME